MYRVGFCVPNSQTIASGFQDEPRFSYVIPDEQARRTLLPWFFHSVAIPACRSHGEIHMTENPASSALWVRPTHLASFRKLLHSEILTAPFKLGSLKVRRAFKLLSRTEEVHTRLVRGPHWFLLAHTGYVASVLQPVLSQADSQDLSCYVEVFDERKLSFYISLGFQFYGAGRVPGGGPNFWSMLRPPQKQMKM